MKISRKIPLLIIILLLTALQAGAQTGGSAAFTFLTLTNSPRTAALGGQYLCIDDDDPFIGARNQSLIKAGMNHQLGLNFIDYFGDINAGIVAYGFTHKRFGNYVASIDFLDYGEFTLADDAGQVLGTFGARDLALNLGWGRMLSDHITMGAGLKLILSSYEEYNASALAVDLSASWHNDDRSTSISVMADNMGAMLNTFAPGGREPLPFRLRMGMSRKPVHVPFRFSVLVDDLQRWDLSYDDPTNPNLSIDPATGEPVERSTAGKITDNTLRHIVLGGEFTPSKTIAIRLGYNYRHRQEMKVSSRLSTIGFSWGLGLNFTRFRFDFARVNYHLAGSYNMFSIRTDVSQFGRHEHIAPES